MENGVPLGGAEETKVAQNWKMENENENHARSLHHPVPSEVDLDQ